MFPSIGVIFSVIVLQTIINVIFEQELNKEIPPKKVKNLKVYPDMKRKL